jgi:uncharacterized protein (TIGR00369 family)
MPDTREALRRFMAGDRTALRFPLGETLGIEIVEVAPGRAVVEMTVDERHANPLGTLHGGILCDLADAAMGLAFSSTLEAEETFTTVELKINLLKPIWRARLRATSTIKRRGRTIGLVLADVTDEKGSLVAHATSTCLLLRGDEARGR